MLRKNKSDFSIWIFNAKAAFSLYLSTAMSFYELHLYSCINFYVGPFFITFLFCCCFFLVLGRVRVRLLCYSIWGFNKEFFTLSFFLYLLNMATSAKSYHCGSKHSTHSFKRLLKTLKREQNVLFVLHFFGLVWSVGFCCCGVLYMRSRAKSKGGKVKWCERVFRFCLR